MSVVPSPAIGDVVDQVSSWTPGRDDPDGEFIYVDLSTVDQDSKTIASSRRIACTDAPSRARQIIQSGDVLVSTVRPNLNAVGRVPVELDGATASTGFCVLRPRSEVADGAYLFHWVRSPRFVGEMVRRATGASYPAISDRIVFESRIPLPPLPEQRRIAEILDTADALRAKRREALAQLDTLTQSIFLDMFGDPATNPKGWPVRTIRDLLESASYGTSEKAEATGEFPVLRMNNITRTGEMDFTELKYMDLKEDQRERYLVRTGDVLFNRTNSAELVGKTAICREANPMAYAGYLIRLRVNRKYEPEYVAAFLNTVYSKRVLRSMCKSIIGMANINATELQAFRIPVPPHPVQHEFAGCITAVEKLKATHRFSLVEQDDLFTTLQQRAFRGDL